MVTWPTPSRTPGSLEREIVMNALTAERATAITTTVDTGMELRAAHLSPMAGTNPVKLDSLAAVERFLKPTTAESIFAGGPRTKVSHVDPQSLVAWVRDVVGDAELAEALNEVASTGEAYGRLVPELKRLIAERLEECRAVLEPAVVSEG